MTTKPALVLLSGLLCDDTVFKEIETELSDVCDITLVSFAGLDSIATMVAKVLAQAPSSFMLIGHSMGGRVALEIIRHSPARVTKLGLFNTGVHPRQESEIAGRERLLEIAKNQGMAKLAQTWLPPMMGSASLENKALMKRLKTMVEKYRYDEFYGQIQALLNRPNAEEVLSLIKIPTLLLSGSEDKWSPVSQHQSMQKHISNSHLSVIPKAGHMAPVEYPKLVALEIKQWMINE